MNAKNAITALLSAPLAADWSVDALAEQVLATIALRSSAAVACVDLTFFAVARMF